MASISINGMNFSGSSICISGDKILIDGKEVSCDDKNVTIQVTGISGKRNYQLVCRFLTSRRKNMVQSRKIIERMPMRAKPTLMLAVATCLISNAFAQQNEDNCDESGKLIYIQSILINDRNGQKSSAWNGNLSVRENCSKTITLSQQNPQPLHTKSDIPPPPVARTISIALVPQTTASDEVSVSFEVKDENSIGVKMSTNMEGTFIPGKPRTGKTPFQQEAMNGNRKPEIVWGTPKTIATEMHVVAEVVRNDASPTETMSIYENSILGAKKVFNSGSRIDIAQWLMSKGAYKAARIHDGGFILQTPESRKIYSGTPEMDKWIEDSLKKGSK